MNSSMTLFNDAAQMSAYQNRGDYLLHSDGEIPSSGLVYVDSALGYSNLDEFATSLGALNLLKSKTIVETIQYTLKASPTDTIVNTNLVLEGVGNVSLKKYIETIAIGMIFSRLVHKGFARNARRILELSQIDWAKEDSVPMSLDSVKGFELFIGEFRHLGEAILGVSDDGTLLASWRIAKNRCLLIEFLNGQLASFSLIAENRDAPDGELRLSGKSFSHEKLQETLKLQGVHKWLQK